MAGRRFHPLAVILMVFAAVLATSLRKNIPSYFQGFSSLAWRHSTTSMSIKLENASISEILRGLEHEKFSVVDLVQV